MFAGLWHGVIFFFFYVSPLGLDHFVRFTLLVLCRLNTPSSLYTLHPVLLKAGKSMEDNGGTGRVYVPFGMYF